MLDLATIKGKLLSDIQAGEQSPDILGKRYGLNGHDLVKNLEQLRKEGFITVKWGSGERIDRVRPANGAANMRLLEGHVGEDQKLRGEHSVRVAEAIARLPWEGEWREWSLDDVRRMTGLNSSQVMSTIGLLRDQGKLLQHGGGGRGLPIRGVRWRGERSPHEEEVRAAAESILPKPEPASEPSQGLAEQFPVVSMIIQLGKELEELTKRAER